MAGRLEMGSHTHLYGCVPEYHVCHCVVKNLRFRKTNSSGYLIWGLLDKILKKHKNSNYIQKTHNTFVNTA